MGKDRGMYAVGEKSPNSECRPRFVFHKARGLVGTMYYKAPGLVAESVIACLLTCSLIAVLSHALTHSLTDSLTHSLTTHSLTL